MRNRLITITLFASLLHACGGGKTAGEAESIEAPAISGSGFSGLAFGAVNRDRNIRTSRVYFYDFAAGIIKETLSGESGSPALFFKDSKLFVLNRDSGLQNLKIVDNVKSGEAAPSTFDLSQMSPGDPWSLETVVSGKSVLLGAPEAGKLFTFDYTTSDLSEVDTAKLKNKPLRPVGLYRSGSIISLVHSGVKKLAADSYTSDGTQAMFRLQIDTEGGLKFIDEDTTTTEVDGTALKGTNPVLAGADAASQRIVGLCNSIISGCNRAIETFASGKLTSVNDFANGSKFTYQLLNQIAEGPSDQEVYAHVVTDAGEYKLILFNALTLDAVDVHTFSDYNLYGFAYDKGSKTLFVGEAGTLSGTLHIYKSNVLTDTIEIGGVLLSSALVQ
jgi:hypothetical protein